MTDESQHRQGRAQAILFVLGAELLWAAIGTSGRHRDSILEREPRIGKLGERLAIFADIDETALSNWAGELHDDFGYVPADSNSSVVFRCGKAIPSTLRIFREAVKDKVAVFFITGRPEGQRGDTAANLKTEGHNSWERLYLRPEDHPKDQTVSQYKSADSAKIIAQGYRIILNVGDQMSDSAGEPRQRTR
jgi:predicted secreted acid phosphatase